MPVTTAELVAAVQALTTTQRDSILSILLAEGRELPDFPEQTAIAAGLQVAVYDGTVSPAIDRTRRMAVSLLAASGQGLPSAAHGAAALTFDDRTYKATSISIASSVQWIVVNSRLADARVAALVRAADWRSRATVNTSDAGSNDNGMELHNHVYRGATRRLRLGKGAGNVCMFQWDAGRSGVQPVTFQVFVV